MGGEIKPNVARGHRRGMNRGHGNKYLQMGLVSEIPSFAVRGVVHVPGSHIIGLLSAILLRINTFLQ